MQHWRRRYVRAPSGIGSDVLSQRCYALNAVFARRLILLVADNTVYLRSENANSHSAMRQGITLLNQV